MTTKGKSNISLNKKNQFSTNKMPNCERGTYFFGLHSVTWPIFRQDWDRFSLWVSTLQRDGLSWGKDTTFLLDSWRLETREYWMIYRGPDFGLVWLLLPPLTSASCISVSVFLCVAGRAYWMREGAVEEPNHIWRRDSSVLYKSLDTLWWRLSRTRRKIDRKKATLFDPSSELGYSPPPPIS
jgi:hypothetical protein